MIPRTADRPVTPPAPNSNRAVRPWAERVLALAHCLATPLDERARAEARGELWLLLSAALARYARVQATSLGHLTREDVEDLVATKALDLLRAIECGRLVFRLEDSGQVPAFLSRVSRNAIIDLLRREGRGGRRASDVKTSVDDCDVTDSEPWRVIRPSNRIEVDELTRALESCLEKLAPRARRIWVFRTFFEMSSKDIGAHPDIGLKPEHVDVLVGRIRTAVRACLEQRGFDASHVDVVGIAPLWDRVARPRTNSASPQ